jgi:ribosomal protein S2
VTYPVPANDASLKVITFVLDEVAKTYADNLGAAPAPAEEKQA